MTALLFAAAAGLIALLWNRCFTPRVSAPVVALFLALPMLYQARTLFTERVDLPGNLAYAAYPWQALGRPGVHANTGIVFTQLAPWTRIARDELLRGNVPLWNRHSASGTPLLANQQTALFHPFTLLGLLLPVGKAFTLSATLRLFTLLFFTFVLFRRWGLGVPAAIFGAIAYTFCTFHIVWLLFPLGLASMMLPLMLTAADVAARERTIRGHALLTIALALSVLGGHPESAFFCWLAAAAYVACTGAIVRCATAFIAAMMLTAFFWYPAFTLLRHTQRYAGAIANPADHGLHRRDWLLPLLAPNIRGTPQRESYQPPAYDRGIVLNDYGEVASGYAGLLTIALAIAAPFVVRRRRPALFLAGLLLVAFCTFAEVPLWREMVHRVPLLGIALHQRLRMFWAFALTGLAALTLDRIRWRYAAPLASVITLIELVALTWNYNPPALPRDVYPQTEAIRRLRAVPRPARMVAWGWTFLPETPGWYGIEDVKSTDPISDRRYERFFRGYLRAEGYDAVIGDVSYPFFDYLNIRSVYAPPGTDLRDPKLLCTYRGADGVIYTNRNALPRYFAVPRFTIEPSFDMQVALSKRIRDFRDEALVDHVPDKILRLAPQLRGGTGAAASVRVVAYEAQRSVLDVDSGGWTLLVSSDVHWPGWRAYVNGQRMPPVTVNGAFLGCFVPGGRSRVEFVYRPEAFTNGLRIGALAVLLLGLGYLLEFRVLRRTTPHQPTSPATRVPSSQPENGTGVVAPGGRRS
jgi:hypothetical protein